MNKNLLLAAAVVLSVAAFAQVPNYVPIAGLQTWYGFNANGNDGSGNGNTLTNFGGLYAPDRFSTAGAAGQFLGSNQYQVVNSPSFSFGQNTTFSISFWFRKTAVGYGVLMMSGTTASGPFIWNFQTGNTDNLQFGTNRQGQAWTWAQATYATGTWTHVVGTYNMGLMTLYMNGVQVTTAVYPHAGATQAVYPLYIARGVGGGNSNALIDDIGIWNRVLSANEILDLHQGCGAQFTTQPTNQTGTIGAVALFSTATLGGSGTYSWQQNAGAGWLPITNSGQFSGATTAALTVNGLTLANNNLQVRCLVAQSTTCADTSNAATLSVCGEIAIQTNDTSVYINNTATFAAQHTDPNATFQWQEDAGSGFINLSNGGGYSGTTSGVLVIANVGMPYDQRLYRTIATSNTCTDTSLAAKLTVVNNIGLDDLKPQALLRLYPNPATHQITIEALGLQNNTPYEMYNLQGVCVKRGVLNQATVYLNDLPQGAYLLQIEGYRAVPFVKL